MTGDFTAENNGTLQCLCFPELPHTTMANLDCKAFTFDDSTLYSMYQACLPVCESSRLESIINTLSPSCATVLGDSLADGQGLNDTVQCPCFLEVPEVTASALNCRGLTDDTSSVYSTYQACLPVCESSELQSIISTLSPSCATLLGDALSGDQSLNDTVQCPCFLEVPEVTASALNCKSSADSSVSVAATHQRCAASQPSSFRTHFVTFQVTAAGSIMDFVNSNARSAMREKIAAMLAVPTWRVALSIRASSVLIYSTIAYFTATDAATAKDALAPLFATTSSASTFLSTPSFALTVEAVVDSPREGQFFTPSSPPPSSPPPSAPPPSAPPPSAPPPSTPSSSGGCDSGCLGGAIGGSIGGLLCLIGIIAGVNYLMKKNQGGPSGTTTSAEGVQVDVKSSM